MHHRSVIHSSSSMSQVYVIHLWCCNILKPNDNCDNCYSHKADFKVNSLHKYRNMIVNDLYWLPAPNRLAIISCLHV